MGNAFISSQKKNESKKFFWRLKLAINSLPFCILHNWIKKKKKKRDNILNDNEAKEEWKDYLVVGHQIKCNVFDFVELRSEYEGEWKALLIKYDDVIALEINFFICRKKL